MTTRKRVVVEAARRRHAPEVQVVRVVVLPDGDADVSYLDQDEFEERKEAFQRGDFTFVGVRAEAEVSIEGVTQHLTSGGLWGIESDSDAAYIEEVAGEEYADLRKILKTIGVATAQLPEQPQVEWRV